MFYNRREQFVEKGPMKQEEVIERLKEELNLPFLMVC